MDVNTQGPSGGEGQGRQIPLEDRVKGSLQPVHLGIV